MHRVGIDRVKTEPDMRALAIGVGSTLLDRLGDQRLADEVFDLWDSLQREDQ